MIQKLNSTYRYNISNQNHKTKESSSIFLNPFIPKISSLSFHFIPRIFECLEIASLFFPSLLPIPHTKRCRCFCSIGQEFCWKNSVTNQWVFPATHIYISEASIHRPDRWIHTSSKSRDSRNLDLNAICGFTVRNLWLQLVLTGSSPRCLLRYLTHEQASLFTRGERRV